MGIKSLLLVLPLALAGCTHPLEIVGDGDIRSSSGDHDCLLEELPCKVVVTGDYVDTYIPEPRSGFRFVGWDNCLAAEGENCVFNVPAANVKQNWFKTMPALVAKFAPLCDKAPADSFSAIQQVIFNGKGCNTGGCHSAHRPAAGLNLATGSSFASIFNVAALSGGGMKLVLPGDSANSYLYRKVAARINPGTVAIAGSAMPPGGSALSAGQLAALAAWIDAGAPQSGRVGELNEVEQLLGLCN